MRKDLPQNSRISQFASFALVTSLAIGLTYLFWWPLWQGGGLIGGDLYPYYFPQKAFLQESLQQGVIPLWNPRVGFGYPVLGESQTAAVYPINLLLYSQLDLNTAYNVSQILHYILAFLATWGLSRRLGLNTGGSVLAAVVFVYGWFAPRICLEWSIIGGAWFAVLLWSAVVFAQTGSRVALIVTSCALGLDLLAGHYNLAFIALLLLICVPWLVKPAAATTQGNAALSRHLWRRTQLVFLLAAIACGFMIGAVQLLPTWELKRQSQRQAENEAFSATYGHLPPASLSQLFLPWAWHAGEQSMDEQLHQASLLAVPDATNKAEAHLYFGLVPLMLILAGLLLTPVDTSLRAGLTLEMPFRWWLVGGIGLLFATGWPTYFLVDVPGIGFFRGPGRYSMVTALAGGLLAGSAWDALVARRRPFTAFVLTAGVLFVTVIDLWSVSREYEFGNQQFFGRTVFYATMVDTPPVDAISESALRQRFAQQSGRVRLYAPGPNVPTLLGVSALPVYLGLGPAIYETDQVRVDFEMTDPAAIEAALNRLRKFGVTHLVLESPLNQSHWPVTKLDEVYDALLNRAFARRDPYYLYEIDNAPGPVRFVTNADDTSGSIRSVNVAPNSVTIETSAPQPAELVLAHLSFPGWRVEIDGKPTSASTVDTLFRSVQVPAGEHVVRWSYHPWSVTIGLLVTCLGIILTCVLYRFSRIS